MRTPLVPRLLAWTGVTVSATPLAAQVHASTPGLTARVVALDRMLRKEHAGSYFTEPSGHPQR